MKRMKSCVVCFLLFSNWAFGWDSSVVYQDGSGRLVYESDAEGNRIPDFSHAGYHSGTNGIPNLSVVLTISPVAGDNTAHIQAAINTVAARTPDANGHRGAILLTKGTYNVSGVVYVNASGIVLRGEGQGSTVNDTIIVGTGTAQMQELGIVLVQGGSVVPGTTQNITSEFVPVGSRTFEVENGAAFAVGDYVVIQHPATAEWLNAVNYGNTSGDEVPWVPLQDDLTMKFEGRITAISGNKIKLDTPIYNELNRSLSQATVFRHNGAGQVTECGIENLRVVSANAGGTDEAHRWDCIHFMGARNCWAKDSTSIGFAQSGFRFTTSSRCTVLNCSSLDPVSQITGGRRYNFRVEYNCHDILFKGCTGTKGRHVFASNGTAKSTGIVFTQCSASGSYTSSENHRRWGSGILWDQITFSSPDPTLDFDLGIGHNRGDWGTSHGWTGAGMVGWNVTAGHIVVQNPPVGQNYAIACKGTVDGQGPFVYAAGFVEGTGQTPAMPSLYEAQLAERLLAHGVGPDAPVKLKVSHYSNTGTRFAALDWTDMALDETAYVIERSSTGGASWSVLTTLPANRVSYTDTSVALNGSYVYRIKATNATGSSAYCNPASVNLAAAESPETKTVQAEYFSAASGTVLKWDGVRWTGQGYADMGNPDTWFDLEVDGGRGGTYPVTIRYASFNGDTRRCSVSVNGVTNGTVIFDESPGKSQWRTETINLALSSGINTIRIQPVDGSWGPDVDYLQLAVVPVIYAAGETTDNTAANAFDSNLNTDWKHYSPYGSWIERVFPVALAITNYTLTSGSGDQANDPRDWKLLGSNDGGTNWTTLDTQSGITFSARKQSKSYALSGGTSYALYRLEVTAVQNLSIADSVQLAELAFSFGALPPVTPNPAAFSVAPYPAGQTAISMTAVPGVSSIGAPVEYYFDEVSGNAGGTDSGWISSPTYTDTGLSIGTLYRYTVMMRDLPGNEGTASAAASATTYPAIANITWTPGIGSDGLWSTGANWPGGVAPMTLEQYKKAMFSISGAMECVLNTNAVTARLSMGSDSGALLRLTSGASLSTGISLDGIKEWSAIGYAKPATVTVEAGAVFNAADVLYLGRDGTGTSSLMITGGIVNAGSTLRAGNALNTSYGVATIQAGGQLSVSNCTFYNANSAVDLRQGSLLLSGDQTTAVNGYLAAGNLITNNSTGTFSMDYNTRNPGKTTVSKVLIQTVVWNPAGGSDGLWATGANWTDGTAPMTIEQYRKVVFNVVGAKECVLNTPATVAHLVIGDNGTSTDNRVRLTSGAHLSAGATLDGAKTWTAVCYNRPATLTVETGAVFETAAHLYVGRDGTGTSSLNIEGGTVNVATTVYIGTNTMLGFITLSGGGQLTAGALVFYNANSVVDVRQGSILLAGDQRSAVNGYIAAGNLIAYRGLGSIEVDYNTSNAGYTTIQAVPPEDGYDAWSVSFYQDIGSETNDYDGDLMNNLYEYALNGNPTDAEDVGTDPALVKTGDVFEYIHLKRNDNPDLVYTVQIRTNLISGVWTNAVGLSSVTNVIGGAYDEVIHTIPTGNPKAYIRLKITSP